MQEQGKHPSLGTKSIIMGHKKSKTVASPSLPQDGEKGIAASQGGKHLAKHGKGSRVIYISDAERKLDGFQYRLGDMVWAKVKSHPWWPGQLYDPSLASASALDLKRESSFLVAFFGDSTFNWFTETELIPYEPNFPQKYGQTSAPNFVDAVEDSLDEARRRVRSGLACRCSASEDASESEASRDGLLYDRQLHDIRHSFEPSTLVSALKQLASSPFSFSQNMFRNTVTGAQTDAFRRFVLHQRLADHKETAALIQRNCVKEHDSIAVETVKSRTLPEKGLLKKQPSKMPSVSKSPGVQKSSIRNQGLEKKVGAMDELGKTKKLKKDAISKKRTMEESKECDRDREVAKDTVLEISIAQSGEHGAAGSKIKALTSEALDRKTDFQESLWGPEQSDACPTDVLSNESSRSLTDCDVLTRDHDKEHIAVNTISNAVPEAERIEVAVMTKESYESSKKAKVVKPEKNQAPKSNASKKVRVTDAELSPVRKKAKVAIKAKGKRSMEDEPTSICRKTKSQKVLPACKGNVDDRPCDLLVETTVSDFLPTSKVLQQADKVITSPKSLESNSKNLQVDASMRLETGANFSEQMPEMVLKSVQLCQEHGNQPKNVDNDAMEASEIQVGSVMQKNGFDGNHQAVYIVHEDITPTIGEEREEKVENAHPLEHRVLPLFEGETVSDTSKKMAKMEDFSNHDSEMNGQGEEDILEIQLKTKDEKMKDTYVSPSRIDSTVLHIDESCPVKAFAGSPGDKIQGVQTNTESSIVKTGQENKRLPRKNMDSKKSLLSKKGPSSKKRAVDEKLSIGLKAKDKKIRSVPLEKTVKLHADFEVKDSGKFTDLNRDGTQAIALRNMHEELMSIAAKPLDAVNEDIYPAVSRAFTNFRNVVYKKAVLQTETSDLVTTSSIALSQGVSEIGSGNNVTRKLMTEQIENKAIVSNDTTGAEPCILEDARNQDGDDNLINQKHSEEGSASLQAMPTKRPITKPPSTSSISLRPAIEAVIPVCGPKEGLNRFGQRFPHAVDATERRMPSLFTAKSSSEGRDLVISFPYGYVLPSEKQLREVFMKFGELNISLTRVDSKNGCAYIVFRHAKDAEAALKSMKVKPVFKNARFWLKPRDANRKEITKLASRNVALSDKPVLASNRLLAEPKVVTEDERRSRTSSDEGLLVHPSKNVHTSDVTDKTAVSANATLVTAQYGGAMHAPSLPMISSNLQKSSITASGPNKGKLDEIHAAVVAPSSVILKAGPGSLVSPITADISEPFLALLHQLHDLVLSTGFVM